MDDRRPTYTFKTSSPPPQVGDVIQIAVAGIDPITVEVGAVSDDGMVIGHIVEEETVSDE